MQPVEVGLIVGAFTIVLSSILAFFIYLNTQIQNLRIEMGKLDVQVSPLWARVQAQIATDLHHPHVRYAEMDRLLEKLESLEITVEERIRLKELLVERSKDYHEDITQDQRSSAIVMVTVMDKVVLEAKAIREGAPMDPPTNVAAVEKPKKE